MTSRVVSRSAAGPRELIRHRRGRVGALRGRHTATTVPVSPLIDTYLVPATAHGARHRGAR
eukprot:6864741-Prymnesium_polylepis.1